MATAFNGADLTWNSVALNVTDISFAAGEIPRVDATHAASNFKTYLAGIADASTMTVTSLVSPGVPGTTSSFSGANILPDGTNYRLESVEESGSVDNVVTYSSTFVKVS